MACLVQNTSSVDTSSSPGWSPLQYGGGSKLDQDAIQIIHCIYCKDCRMEKLAAERAKLTGEGTSSDLDQAALPPSPQTRLEEISLQQTMDKNKESLKRKLMLRRSVNELVDRGIYPPLKTPPAYAEQRKQLERAKTGDLLRHKIQCRPDRQSLVQQHILEDTKIDPSLHERQRLLKKARLTDGLNTKLAHRPGPLELVEGNILKTSEELVEAIKDGSIAFHKTTQSEEGAQHFVFDDESISDGVPSPPQDESSLSDISSPSSSMPPPLAELAIPTQRSPPAPPIINKPSPSLLTSHQVTSPKNGNSTSNGNNKQRPKKPKTKPATKLKVIKFHEYKGPPNIVKNIQSAATAVAIATAQPPNNNNNNNNNNNETPYHVMLEQQQLFLQWQLEFQQKNMPFLLTQKAEGPVPITAAPIPGTSSASGGVMVTAPTISPKMEAMQTIIHTTPALQQHQIKQEIVQQPSPQPPSPVVQHHPTPHRTSNKSAANNAIAASMPKLTCNLEELKVADLKAELKKRNLPVSGAKPQLIERLRPYTEVPQVAVSPSPSQASVTISPANSPQSSVALSFQSPASVPDMNAVSPPPPIQTVNTILNVQSMANEENANISSPNSPANMESAISPMSPENMEVTNVTLNQLKNHLGQLPISMSIDQSRPPSVLSTLSTDVAPMEVDQAAVDPAQGIATIPTLSPAVQMQIQQAQLQQLQKTQLQLHQLQQLQQLQQIQQAQCPTQLQLTQDDILRQQQKHIEDLQRQLQESQIRLQLQQLQQAQLQHQNQQLLQQSVVQSTAAVTAPAMNTIHISVPMNNKTTPLQTTTSIAKPIQIPTHLLQTAQGLQSSAAHGIPAVIVTNKQKQTTTGVADILKHATLHESLNLGKSKAPVTMSTMSTANIQPFIFTTKPASTPLTLNGIQTSSVRSPSMPNSPLEAQKVLTRSSSNPFFSLPMKEPPKYDDAIKQIQHNIPQANTVMSHPERGSSKSPDPTTISHKSPMMDDVLEILIRHGDLPPSAANEPLATPKTTEAMPLPTVAISQPVSMPNNSLGSSCGLTFSKGDVIMSIPSTNTVTVNSLGIYGSAQNFVDTQNSVLKTIKREMPDMSAPVVVTPPLPPCPADTSTELLDLTEMLSAGELGGMDWTNDHNFTGLDLSDPTPVCLDSKLLCDKGFLNVPITFTGAQKSGSTHGSEPDLASLGLNDTDANSNMQIDVSDWLDVIVPSTGLTPLSTNAPVSFSSDPILTPKTQQEVLDLFNFEESDFNTPTDSQIGLSWDKLAEPSTSSS